MWQAILKSLPFIGYGLLAFFCILAIIVGCLYWQLKDYGNDDDGSAAEDIGI